MNLLGLKRIRARAWLVVAGHAAPHRRRHAHEQSLESVGGHGHGGEGVGPRSPQTRRRQRDGGGPPVRSGHLVLRELFPEEYNRLLDHPIEFFVANQCELEEEFVGVNHAEVGARLLRHWGLPDEITEAIRYHHRPADLQGENSAAIERAFNLHFASLIGQLQLAPSEPSLVTGLLTLAAERFDMDAQQLEKFLEPLHKNIEEFAALINVQIGDTQHYPTVLANATEQLAQIASETALENIRVHEEKDRVDRLRQQSEAELDRLSRAHELILDAAGEGIFGVDLQGNITFINPAAARTIGWTREELVGQFHHDLLRPAEGGQPPPAWEQSFIHAVLRDGQTRYLEDGRFSRATAAASRFAALAPPCGSKMPSSAPSSPTAMSARSNRPRRRCAAVRSSSARRRRWRRSAGWPAAWPTISTIC